MNTVILEGLGYQVTKQTESKEALKVFQNTPRDFDLILTDMNMPHMSGLDLGLQIHSIRPDIPIILCSGFSEIIDGPKTKDMGIQEYLMKPVQRGKLAVAVREALDCVKNG